MYQAIHDKGTSHHCLSCSGINNFNVIVVDIKALEYHYTICAESSLRTTITKNIKNVTMEIHINQKVHLAFYQDSCIFWSILPFLFSVGTVLSYQGRRNFFSLNIFFIVVFSLWAEIDQLHLVSIIIDWIFVY